MDSRSLLVVVVVVFQVVLFAGKVEFARVGVLTVRKNYKEFLDSKPSLF